MKRRHILTLLCLAMVVYVATARTRVFGPNGVSDEKVQIENAIEHFVALQLADMHRIFTYNVNMAPYNSAPYDGNYHTYASADEFRTLNPDCCRFSYRGSDGWLPNWRKRAVTNYAGVVTINYILRRNENGEVIETTHHAEIPMNSRAEPIPLSEVRMGRFE